MAAPRWISALLLGVCAAVLSGGCDREAVVVSESRPRPVKTMVVTAGSGQMVRTFAGVVEAPRRVELAFQVPGLLQSLPVREGQRVSKGEVIAQLRSDEFAARLATLEGQLDQARVALGALRAGERVEERQRRESQVRSAEARLVNARSEYERMASLIGSGAVSRLEYDRSQTAYRVAQEEYASARRVLEQGEVGREEDILAQEAVVRGLEGSVVEANIQLADTTLRAPYDGVIAQVLGRQNQSVRAKDPVVRFQDADEIDIAVDVPESIMAREIRTGDILELTAEFSGVPGLRFPVRVREIAQAADPVTQTFTVRVAMLVPEGINLLPGMSASVSMVLRRAEILGDSIRIPISAVYSDQGGVSVAWVVKPDGTVQRRQVELGQAHGNEVEVRSGLEAGERIAVAGVRFLRDGMIVRDLGDSLGARR